jgi:single-strand DNA-binding protein
MASINKVILIGRLGKDPELKYTQSGQPVAGFSLATHEVWRDKQGQKQEALEWHNVTVWGKAGENCDKYLNKGSHVYIEGQIKTDSYEKNGEKRYSTKIVAREVKFLSSRNDTQAPRRDIAPLPKKEEQSLEDIPF